jgi:hypothetical protein
LAGGYAFLVWTDRERGAGDRCALPEALGNREEKSALRQMGIDKIYLGKKQRFLTMVSN